MPLTTQITTEGRELVESIAKMEEGHGGYPESIRETYGPLGSMLSRDESEDWRATQRIEERSRTEMTRKSGKCQSCRGVKAARVQVFRASE